MGVSQRRFPGCRNQPGLQASLTWLLLSGSRGDVKAALLLRARVR